METLRDVSIWLINGAILFWWVGDFLCSTFGPPSLYQLWHQEAHFSGISYGWFLASRLALVAVWVITGVWMKTHEWLTIPRSSAPDELQAFGRCVGHGGMPLSLGAPKKQPTPKFYDVRIRCTGYGVDGHVNLAFDGSTLAATYVDLTSTAILEEMWSVDPSGTIALQFFATRSPDPDFHA